MKLRKGLAAFAAISALAVGMGALPAAADYDRRDVNQDGTVSIQDVIYLNQYLMGYFYVSNPSVLDANQNLIVDGADSYCVLASLTDSVYTWEFIDVMETTEG